MAMSETWEQLIGELDLSAQYRRKRRDRDFSSVRNPPGARTRMADLKISAAEVTAAGQRPMTPTATAISRRSARIRPTLLDDQVKLNDPGASQYIIDTLAKDGWNGLLRFHEGEIWRLRNRAGDDARAAQGYAAAVPYPDAPPDAWRWHGIMLLKQGRSVEARSAFARYLQWRPTRPTRRWVRQMMAG